MSKCAVCEVRTAFFAVGVDEEGSWCIRISKYDEEESHGIASMVQRKIYCDGEQFMRIM